MASIRTRIAPSPTGPLHIGTARTALFNYLFAKHHGGAFVVRIEDTDLERSEQRFENDIIDGLDWLGIKADESPAIGGPFAPYRQTERVASYTKYLKQLLAAGKAFYCFHSERELEFEAEEQMTQKLPLVHRCAFRDLPPDEAEAKLASGESAIIRLKNPGEKKKDITFTDLIRGQVHFSTRLLGDFSIAKNLETPLYNFAVVIDDYEMKISHVIRGEDHIPNTPKQLLIAEALGWTTQHGESDDPMPPWQYAHLPLILGTDRTKLSKRHGATSIAELRSQGYLPEALVNFMALLGWNPGDDREIFSLEELTKTFDLSRVQSSGAIWNQDKLDWINAEYIRRTSLAKLKTLLRTLPFPNPQWLDGKEAEAVIALEQPRLRKLSEFAARVDYFLTDPDYPKELLAWKDMGDGAILESLERSRALVESLEESDFQKETLEKKFLAMIGSGGKGEILWPLRVALTGKKESPGPFEIMEVLGRERTLSRIRTACTKVSG